MGVDGQWECVGGYVKEGYGRGEEMCFGDLGEGGVRRVERLMESQVSFLACNTIIEEHFLGVTE